MSQVDLSPLFTPLTVRGVTLRNRFVLPAMQRAWCEDGAPPAAMAEYYRQRAEGGAALILSEACAVDHVTATAQPRASRMNAATQEAWAACFDAAHRHGGRFFLQLWHEGGSRDPSDGQTITPSGLLGPDIPAGRIATEADMQELREAYARSARLAVEAGADGVEVHCCHGYFLDLWLWAKTNRRADGYGGDDVADRVRFPCEVIAAVRDAVGPDVPVSVRFSQWKEVDYQARAAQTPAELEAMIAAFRRAGADLVSASTRWFDRPAWPELDDRLSLAGWVKRVTDAPVVTVGSVGLDVDVMNSLRGSDVAQGRWEESLAELMRRFRGGEFDLVAVGRSLIADPEFVAKVRDGRYDEIRVFTKADIKDLDAWESELLHAAERRALEAELGR
ncbi:MAG TPA: hypothetical protein VHB30_09425 [Solirubrobacteraceae bacterium]|nr:hypothetical protein [Solirubrobacteraceae bacterium]